MTTFSRPLSTLPEELLCSILSYLPTRKLLGVSSTSHRVHDTAYYLVEQRFKHIDELNGFSLVFECFAPAAKMDTPYYQCTYSGTPLLPKQPLAETYSHFLPQAPPSRSSAAHAQAAAPKNVVAHIHLEEAEYFTQRCCSSILAKPGPRRGLFTDVLPVHNESIFRLRRSWLVEAALEGRSRTLWVDDEKDIGVVVRVHMEEVPEDQHSMFRGGIAGGDDEGEAVFSVEYQEVLVRTGALCGALELQKKNGTQKTGPEGMFGMQPYYCWPWIQQGPALVVF